MKKRLPSRGQADAGTSPRKSLKPAGTILLVDDDQVARGHMAKALVRQGYSLLEAGDGEEALTRSMACKRPINLLITDVMMPVMNGKELAERLGVLRPEIRILFISGYTREEILTDSARGRREWWLAKPFTGAQLTAKVKQVLSGVLPI